MTKPNQPQSNPDGSEIAKQKVLAVYPSAQSHKYQLGMDSVNVTIELPVLGSASGSDMGGPDPEDAAWIDAASKLATPSLGKQEPVAAPTVPLSIAHDLWYQGSRLHSELKDALVLHPEIWHAEGLRQMLDRWHTVATKYASEVLLATLQPPTEPVAVEVVDGESYARGFLDCQEEACQIAEGHDAILKRIELLEPLFKVKPPTEPVADWEGDTESYGDFIESNPPTPAMKDAAEIERLRGVHLAAESLINFIKIRHLAQTPEAPFVWKCPYMQRLDDALALLKPGTEER